MLIQSTEVFISVPQEDGGKEVILFRPDSEPGESIIDHLRLDPEGLVRSGYRTTILRRTNCDLSKQQTPLDIDLGCKGCIITQKDESGLTHTIFQLSPVA